MAKKAKNIKKYLIRGYKKLNLKLRESMERNILKRVVYAMKNLFF